MTIETVRDVSIRLSKCNHYYYDISCFALHETLSCVSIALRIRSDEKHHRSLCRRPTDVMCDMHVSHFLFSFLVYSAFVSK